GINSANDVHYLLNNYNLINDPRAEKSLSHKQDKETERGDIQDKFGKPYYIRKSNYYDRESGKETPHKFEIFDSPLDAAVKRPVGQLELDRATATVGDVKIEEEFRRKGIAAAAYEYIQKEIGETLQ